MTTRTTRTTRTPAVQAPQAAQAPQASVLQAALQAALTPTLPVPAQHGEVRVIRSREDLLAQADKVLAKMKGIATAATSYYEVQAEFRKSQQTYRAAFQTYGWQCHDAGLKADDLGTKFWEDFEAMLSIICAASKSTKQYVSNAKRVINERLEYSSWNLSLPGGTRGTKARTDAETDVIKPGTRFDLTLVATDPINKAREQIKALGNFLKTQVSGPMAEEYAFFGTVLIDAANETYVRNEPPRAAVK